MQEKKRIRIRYRLSVVFFGTILIFGLMFYHYMKTVTLEDVLSEKRTITVFSDNTTQKGDTDNKGEDTDDTDLPLSNSAAITNPVPEREAADESYLNSCVFVGDYITYGLGSYGVVPSSNVLSNVALSLSNIDTVQIDTSSGSVTVIEALADIQPKNVYIMLGSNGAAYMSPTEMYTACAAFLNKVRIACPDSEVYIISAPPVTQGKENSQESPIKNSVLDELNKNLLQYADNNGVHYLDMNSALKDDSGYLPAESAENDGLHFKRSTYDVFIDYILTHVAS